MKSNRVCNRGREGPLEFQEDINLSFEMVLPNTIESLQENTNSPLTSTPLTSTTSGGRMGEILNKYINKYDSIMDDLDSSIANQEKAIELSTLEEIFEMSESVYTNR